MKAFRNMSRRQTRMAVFLVMVSICLSYLMYSYAVPRTELTVTTVVHYSFSGISMGLVMKNTGTNDITDLGVNITILHDGTGALIHEADFPPITMGRGTKTVHSLTFTAPQRDPYRVVIHFDFTSDGKQYNESAVHTMEDYLNHVWKDTFRDWRI